MDKNQAEKNSRKKPSNYHPMLVDTRDAEFNQVPGVGHYRLEFQEISARKKSAAFIHPKPHSISSRTPTIPHSGQTSKLGFAKSPRYLTDKNMTENLASSPQNFSKTSTAFKIASQQLGNRSRSNFLHDDVISNIASPKIIDIAQMSSSAYGIGFQNS